MPRDLRAARSGARDRHQTAARQQQAPHLIKQLGVNYGRVIVKSVPKNAPQLQQAGIQIQDPGYRGPLARIQKAGSHANGFIEKSTPPVIECDPRERKVPPTGERRVNLVGIYRPIVSGYCPDCWGHFGASYVRMHRYI